MDRVLIIDDDSELCMLISRFLSGEGFEIHRVGNGNDGVKEALSGEYDLVMLDVMMPDIDGFEVLRQIRARSRTPILMLTARGDTLDRVVGLEMGADDYLPKPFDPSELAARIRAILRRSKDQSGAAEPRIISGDIELNPATRSVRQNGRAIDLTMVEFDLLASLIKVPGVTVSREELVRKVLGREFSPFDRSIDTHIYNLRRKIGAGRIKGVRGTGYFYAKSIS
jgi:two-component system response regulator CpxR